MYINADLANFRFLQLNVYNINKVVLIDKVIIHTVLCSNFVKIENRF